MKYIRNRGTNRKDSGGRRLVLYVMLSFLLLIAGPFLLGGVGSWLGARFSEYVFGSTSTSEEEQLREDLMQLMLENSILREEAMKAENYRTLLGITRTDERDAVPAKVLYRSEGLVTGTMVIDKGSNHGITDNSVCISADGLVGVVTVSGEATSEVLPILNPSVNVSCVTWPSGAYGILQSSSLGELQLVHVDLSSEVRAGDQVLTSRFGSVYPDGILVGRVTGVSSDEPGLALKLDVAPAVDFQSTGEVLILLPEGNVNAGIE
ncbi:MAG: rod shape-determining protein MreC [Candidatus Aegiribacteria sp.]|nr:rod shape-determining protein MreC [Candidatus Aegiribacteria sp.]MBD3295021.1 rod shape-determining protein MreC [Candidatus Fermentibacteria bacterium]